MSSASRKSAAKLLAAGCAAAAKLVFMWQPLALGPQVKPSQSEQALQCWMHCANVVQEEQCAGANPSHDAALVLESKKSSSAWKPQ